MWAVRFPNCVRLVCVFIWAQVSVAEALTSVHQRCCCFSLNSCLRSEKYLNLALCSFSCIWTVRSESWVWKCKCLSSRLYLEGTWGCFRSACLFLQTWPLLVTGFPSFLFIDVWLVLLHMQQVPYGSQMSKFYPSSAFAKERSRLVTVSRRLLFYIAPVGKYS